MVRGSTTIAISSVRSLQFVLKSANCLKTGSVYPPFSLKLAVASGTATASTTSLFNGISSDVQVSLGQVFFFLSKLNELANYNEGLLFNGCNDHIQLY